MVESLAMVNRLFGFLRETRLSVVDEALQTVREVAVKFFKHDVPNVLFLTAQSMRKADYDSALNMSRLLDLAPIVGAIIVACTLPFVLLWNDKTTETYHLTRKMIIKFQALLYAMGFAVSAIQHRALWGSQGLIPVNPSFQRPSPIFQIFGFGDLELEAVSWAGLCLAVIVLRYDQAAVTALMFAMWVMYLSIINLQASFTFGYGWEWGTLELGFLAIFFVPLVPCRNALPPSRIVIWLYRWAAFRLLLGAGMSKVGRNSSACWRELTCTDTHYYTQPIPNPLSWYFHFLPPGIHRIEVALTFLEQLCLPWLMLVPNRICRYVTGSLEIFFQLCIVGTGNYAWINFYGMLPVLALFDDDFFRFFLNNRVTFFLISPEPTMKHSASWLGKIYRWTHGLVIVVLACVIAVKSTDPIQELFSPAPWINNYDPLFIMNSQGVFGFINQHRVQPVLQFTHNANSSLGWKNLDFKCLPGSIDRTPCLMSPYHYRLDWETWIATTARMEDSVHMPNGGQVLQDSLPDFLRTLINRLLHGDDDAMGLMGRSDLYDYGPPAAIRIRFYSYTFDPSGKNTWKRKPLGPARIYKKSNLGPGRIARRSPRERHWILGASMLGCVLELGMKSPFVVSYVAVFAAALMADYEPLCSASLYLSSNFIAGATFMGLLLPLYARRKGTAAAQEYVKKQWHNIVACAAIAFYSYNAYRSYT